MYKLFCASKLTNEELIALEEEKVAEKERRNAAEKEEEEEDPERTFTTKGLSEGLSQLNKLLAHFEGMVPNIERFARIERMVLDAFRPYREIYDEKKKRTIQTKLSMFMKKTTPPATPTPALTSTIHSQARVANKLIFIFVCFENKMFSNFFVTVFCIFMFCK